MSDRVKLWVCGLAIATIVAPIDAVLVHWWQLSEPQAFALFASQGLLIALVYPLAFISGAINESDRR